MGRRHDSALAAALYELISDRTRREEMGARASAYARDTHNIEKIARRYAEIVRHGGNAACPAENEPCANIFRIPKLSPGASGRRPAARPRPFSFLSTAGCGGNAPRLRSGRTDGERCCLCRTLRKPASFFAHAFAWRPEQITAMTLEEFLPPELRDGAGKPIPQNAFAFALAIAPTTLPEILAATLLRRLNAALRRGGNLTFEIWSSLELEDNDAPLAEPRMVERLSDAGFAEASRVYRRQDGFFPKRCPPSAKARIRGAWSVSLRGKPARWRSGDS